MVCYIQDIDGIIIKVCSDCLPVKAVCNKNIVADKEEHGLGSIAIFINGHLLVSYS